MDEWQVTPQTSCFICLGNMWWGLARWFKGLKYLLPRQMTWVQSLGPVRWKEITNPQKLSYEPISSHKCINAENKHITASCMLKSWGFSQGTKVLTVPKASLFTVSVLSVLCFPCKLDLSPTLMAPEHRQNFGTQNPNWVPPFHIQKCVKNKWPQVCQLATYMHPFTTDISIFLRNGSKQWYHWDLKEHLEKPRIFLLFMTVLALQLGNEDAISP